MNKLRIALQRSGRLADGSRELLAKCGIKAHATKNQLLTQDDNFGLDFIFARDDDIPGLIANGICDIGIIGENLLAEYSYNNPNAEKIKIIRQLGFSQCKLSIAMQKSAPIKEISDLNNKVIATSYPNILQEFLNNNKIQAKIVVMHGSVELAPQIGIADYICDLVSSGATLSENGLVEFMPVLHSQAILIGRNGAWDNAKQNQCDRLNLRIQAVQNAQQNKYIMLHIERSKIPLLAQIMPGCESPTILELQGHPDKVAIHVVSQEEVFWEVMEQLKSIGATSILVLPIEKMIF